MVQARNKNRIVGQIGNLPPIVNRPVNLEPSPGTPINNRRQVTNLPHKIILMMT